MNGTVNDTLGQLPDEMFTIIAGAGQRLGPRLGRLALPGRRVIDTPHYLGNTSRGVVPHITQDTFRRDTNISGVFVPLEDFIERAPKDTPPLYKYRPDDGSSPLRRFIALPDDSLLVLGARRTPPVEAPIPNPNTNSTIAVCTAVGFKPLKASDYADAAESLGADIIVSLGDIPYGRSMGSKRLEKATDRQVDWIKGHAALRNIAKDGAWNGHAKLFALLLPISCASQRFYIDCLQNELAGEISGLAFYDLAPLEDLPDSLAAHPRLAFTEPSSPREILRQVACGLDVFTVPFVGAATDAGIALDFRFPTASAAAPSQDGLGSRPLGIDMWSTAHAVDISPLSKECECYACTNHHRAYVQHLLAAKEMLGWVLLQIHNHHIIDSFFSSIRQSIARGTLEEDTQAFEREFESQLPEKTGQGPRIRGYQFKAEGPGEPKKNKAAFIALNDGEEKLVEAELPSADANADDLQDRGFAEEEQ